MRKEVPSTRGGRPSGWRIAAWSIAGLLWLLPLAAMQVTDEVNWTASDFVFAAALIGGVGLVMELAVRSTRSIAYRGGVAVLAAVGFLLIWMNAAVGIIGNEDNSLNLLYAGVIAVALIGGAAARFRARGMARAVAAAAATQALVGVGATVAGRNEPPGAIRLMLLHAILVALFACSAWLFSKAAADRGAAPAGS